MTLATVRPDGTPSSRVVILSSVSEATGFEFGTHRDSPKLAEQVRSNPAVALTFCWPAVSRQVRVEGRAIEGPREAAQALWAKRPLRSRLAVLAAVKPQSARLILPDDSNEFARYRDLEEKAQAADHENEDQPSTAVPDQWVAVHVDPCVVEFWEAAPEDALVPENVRVRYVRRNVRDEPLNVAAWDIESLQP